MNASSGQHHDGPLPLAPSREGRGDVRAPYANAPRRCSFSQPTAATATMISTIDM